MIPTGIQGGTFVGEKLREDFYACVPENRGCPSAMTGIRIGGAVYDALDSRRDDRPGAGRGAAMGGTRLQGDIEGGACKRARLETRG